MEELGRQVMRKHTSCFLRASHSARTDGWTLRVRVTSARTRAGQTSPTLGFNTSITEKEVICCKKKEGMHSAFVRVHVCVYENLHVPSWPIQLTQWSPLV